jgi:hypothetical protein
MVAFGNEAQTAEDELVASGVRVPGRAVTVAQSHRGGWMVVQFRVDGVERWHEITLAPSSPDYRAGDQVVVIYDPADPDRVRTDLEPTDSTGFEAVTYIAGLCGLFGLPSSSAAIVRWWRRVRSLGRGPWKTGVASLEKMDWQRTLLWIRFESGEKRSLITTWGGRDVSVKMVGNTGIPVVVGGDGTALTAVFAEGALVVAVKPWRTRRPRNRSSGAKRWIRRVSGRSSVSGKKPRRT